MFERFKRSSNRDVGGNANYENANYQNGPEFQRGDGYANDGATTTQQPVNTGSTTGATAAGDRPASGGTTGYDNDGRAGADYDRDTRTGDDHHVGRGGAAVGGAAAGGAAGYAAGSHHAHEQDARTGVVDRPGAGTAATAGTAGGPASAAEAREIQRERFGGADGTAIFFGWLSALGLAALLLAVVAAAGTRLGFATGVNSGDAKSNAGTIGIVGAAILVVILLLAYYCGGYVAGRMARFDGGRQGFRVWLLGLLVTIAAAVAGWIGGSQYNVFQQLNLPRIPVDEGSIATGAIITLVVILVGTLLAAMAGGKAGDRYHARVDATAWDRNRV